MNPVTYEILTRRVKQLGNLPAMPVLLTELSDALSMPPSCVDVDKIAETINYDESLTAQCLRMANSALYRQRGDVATVREAVVALGLWRIRDLAFACSLPLMFASLQSAVRKELFWRHALATAVLAQAMGHDFGNTRNEETYLAGLLHDIGILINGLLFPEDFRDVMKEAVEERSALAAVEQRVLGFTHAESGRILAELWKLPVSIGDVIEYHHHPADQTSRNETTVLVQLANQWCWKSGLGYGYPQADYEWLTLEETWETLVQRFPRAPALTCRDYESSFEKHVLAARELTEQVFALETVTH